jgi:hypothetical protein
MSQTEYSITPLKKTEKLALLAHCALSSDNVSLWTKQRLWQMNECEKEAIEER